MKNHPALKQQSLTNRFQIVKDHQITVKTLHGGLLYSETGFSIFIRARSVLSSPLTRNTMFILQNNPPWTCMCMHVIGQCSPSLDVFTSQCDKSRPHSIYLQDDPGLQVLSPPGLAPPMSPDWPHLTKMEGYTELSGSERGLKESVQGGSKSLPEQPGELNCQITCWHTNNFIELNNLLKSDQIHAVSCLFQSSKGQSCLLSAQSDKEQPWSQCTQGE